MNCTFEVSPSGFCKCTRCKMKAKPKNGVCPDNVVCLDPGGQERTIVSGLKCVWEPYKRNYCRCVRCGIKVNKAPDGTCNVDRVCGSKGPSTIRKAVNVAAATAKHVVTGMKIISEEDTAKRVSVCTSGCDLFIRFEDRGYCSHQKCGCDMKANVADFFNKASWEEQKCPHPKGDKWRMTEEQLKEIGHPEVAVPT